MATKMVLLEACFGKGTPDWGVFQRTNGDLVSIVTSGRGYDGREGWMGVTTELDSEDNTGWLQPIGWVDVNDCELHRHIADQFEDADPRWTPKESEEDRVRRAAKLLEDAGVESPDVFPGLREHYPEVAKAFGTSIRW